MKNDILEQLKKFITENNIVGTSAGVCIALAVKDGIQSLVGDVILPLLVILIKMLHIDFLKQYFPENEKSNLDVTSFVKQMITFILVIITSFIFVKFSFEYLLNIKNIDENKKIKKINTNMEHLEHFENYYQ